ncbi:hypothetical protein pb186bvf_011791 [Paramecium bursaria]
MKKHFQKKAKQTIKRPFETIEDELMDYDDSIDDDQYQKLIYGIEPVKRQYVGLDKKYQGKKVQKQLESDSHQEQDDESINSDEIPEIDQQQDNTEHLDIQRLEDEDIKIAQQTKYNLQEMTETSHMIKEQLQLWQNLVEIRQQLQKNIEIVKKLPIKVDQFKTKTTQQNISTINQNISQNIDKLVEMHKQLYPKDIDDLDQYLAESYENVKDDILKWSQKTAMISSLRTQNNFLMQTPIGQTNKAMQNKEKLYLKTQLKRSIYRILGEDAQDMNEMVNKNIYDDNDFYIDLLKETITQDNTQLILKRQAQRQEKVAKVVDRKASKCRKIRFEPHQKLVNFMSRQPEQVDVYSREDILFNLFGQTQKVRKDQYEGYLI